MEETNEVVDGVVEEAPVEEVESAEEVSAPEEAPVADDADPEGT